MVAETVVGGYQVRLEIVKYTFRIAIISAIYWPGSKCSSGVWGWVLAPGCQLLGEGWSGVGQRCKVCYWGGRGLADPVQVCVSIILDIVQLNFKWTQTAIWQTLISVSKHPMCCFFLEMILFVKLLPKFPPLFRTRLSLKLSERRDEGTYYCVSKNELGITRANIQVFSESNNILTWV